MAPPPTPAVLDTLAPPRALSPLELRTMTDRERALWVQAALPQHFVACPACERAPAGFTGCPRCLGTRRLSKAGARAWYADRGIEPRPEVEA